MKNIFKNTWRILDKKEKKHFRLLIILDIAISILDILSLALLLWIIQFYIQPGDSRDISFLPQWLTNKNSVGIIAVFLVFFSIKNIAAYFIVRAHYRFNSRVAIRISRNNLLDYQLAGYHDFVDIDSSVHVRKICFQPFEFCQQLLSGIQQVITQVCLISIAIIAILLFNAKLFLLLLALLLPPVIIVFYVVKKRMVSARKSIRTNNERSFQYLLDALKGYVESNIYGRHEFFMRRFIDTRKKFSNSLFDSLAMQSLPGRIIEIFAILGLFILIVIAKWSGNEDTTSLLTIGAFMAAAYKIIPGIVKIINISGQMRAYEFSVDDFSQPPAKANYSNEKLQTSAIQSVQLKNINFSFANLPVLQNFDLLIRKGDFLGISGASGKGKTTILNILLGFLAPVKGEMLINDTAEMIRNWWPSVAYVRQQTFFIHDTLLRNITLQEEEHDKGRLQYALNISGLADFVSRFPEGLDKMITENGKNISGGQQQRIALARALYKNADLILLDEPFNELDESSEIFLLEHFMELARQGKMILLITHNKKSLSYCSKIISLDEQG